MQAETGPPRVAPPSRRAAAWLNRYGYLATFLALLLVCWHFVTTTGRVAEYLLPQPAQIVQALIETRQLLLGHTLFTLGSTLGGFVLGGLFSMLFGALIVFNEPARRTFMPTIVFLQAMPKVALAPLFVVWLGFGSLTNVVITATVSFFPILVNFIAGMEDIHENELRLMRSYNASRWQIFRHVQIYRALPYLFAGFKMGIILAVIGAVVAELVVGKSGLGYWTFLKMSYFQTADMFAALVLLGVVSVGLYWSVELVQRLTMPWRAEEDASTGVAVM
jgi:NitT/TauT family transport system permease protein